VTTTTFEDHARRVLLGGSLADKLAIAPRDVVDGAHQPWTIDRPVRDDAIALQRFKEKLPAQPRLGERDARVRVVARFAHHELMAAELFAWALLSFPDADARLRVGWMAALREEQQHCQLYLDRLADDGVVITDIALSGYFWDLIPSVRAHAKPVAAFLAMQGLTLEQANLDFTIMYRDAFTAVGDTTTAAILQQIHDDEIGHVRLAHRWLTDGGVDDVAAYQRAVPFPMSAGRAKGRRVDRPSRRRAGLSEAFIDHVERATLKRQPPPT
jgi:uncharacterized ferritin-like protein (DUF455 family)